MGDWEPRLSPKSNYRYVFKLLSLIERRKTCFTIWKIKGQGLFGSTLKQYCHPNLRLLDLGIICIARDLEDSIIILAHGWPADSTDSL